MDHQIVDAKNIKRCWRCKEVKSLTDFYRSAERADGHQASCKKCGREIERAYYLRNAQTHKRQPSEKTCSHCKTLKTRKDFTISHSSPDGLDYLCRACKSERHKAYARKNVRAKNIWVQYRLTEAQYEAMLVRQEYKCAICGVCFGKVQTPAIDHCHATGKARGALCRRCNTLLAGLEANNGEFFRRAIRYLREHGQEFP